MAAVKRFLIIFVVAYLVIATGINLTLGPPAMSKGYLAEFKDDHNRYIESVKNKDYKIFIQRPHLFDLDAAENAELSARVAFVEEYEQRDLFKKEESRRNNYELIFDLFNTAMVIVLVVQLGRKPLIGVIDGMIESIRKKISDADRARETSDERLDAAERKIKGLTEDLAGYEKFVEERVENIRRDSALFTGESMSVLNTETQDRKQFVEVQARQMVKEMLVDAALGQVLADFQASGSAEQDDVLVNRFLADLREESL